ncbi:DgaE family pyridoxal phosphate-dependent ammonia lyase [Brevibacillus humidisoli]|uniref:DgaE family pyridoxal phosphate-dependent ammonia lyase n=1 Tax=Brevibacillus humidisoli TaxID=2895522 RepID=UPI001E2D9E24|nr:DgaE family pyridoxal phosphate-dependent ammonia lyase [Brevibacillus humidisoli]UFJ39101.1 DgaE family pyridoxal phosphate-dependent ammonia lyase [Brevibacillus humidisoli]
MNIYQRYGLRQVINASGKMTALGASAVHPSVAQAMGEAAMEYVDIAALIKAAGQKIAAATGAEDGCPTLGAAAGIAISTAAVIAGTNLRLIEQLPLSEGLANEVIVQKGHAVHFGGSVAQMVRLGGGKVVEAGHANLVEAAHIEAAINERTVALLYIKSHHAVQKGMQSLETMLAVAHRHALPLIVDAAAEEDLTRYVQAGADLVIYSGGKAIGGPTSGLICGRANLIEACRAQYKGIGRAMKVGKEAIIGLLAALARYDRTEAEAEQQRKRMEWLAERINELSGVSARVIQDEAGRPIYRAQLTIDREVAGIDAYAVIRRLEAGNPAIYTRNHYANLGVINIDPRPLFQDQEQIILERIRAIFANPGEEKNQ